MSAFVINPYVFAWTPANIATALWLDANDASTLTLNGGNVSEWRDKSGQNTHAIQATAANQPAYSATSFFGKPALTFDGSNDTLVITTSLMQSNTTHGVYWVMERVGAGSGVDGYRPAIGILHATNLDRGALHYINPSNQGASFPYYFGPGTNSYDGLSSYSSNVGYIHAFQSNVTGWGVWRNGTLEGTTNGITAPNNTNIGYTLARQFSQSRASNIRMSEVIAVSSASTDNRQRIEGYLAWKWDLVASLPAGHPYKTTPPAS